MIKIFLFLVAVLFATLSQGEVLCATREAALYEKPCCVCEPIVTLPAGSRITTYSDRLTKKCFVDFKAVQMNLNGRISKVYAFSSVLGPCGQPVKKPEKHGGHKKPQKSVPYKIVNQDNLALTLDEASNRNGATLTVRPQAPQLNNQQLFYFWPHSTYYFIYNHYQSFLEVYGNHVNEGAQVKAWQYHGGTNQQWNVTARGRYYSFESLLSGRSLTPQRCGPGGVNSFATVMTWRGQSCQKWTVVPGRPN